jgi:hypothetical protein
MAYGAHYQVPGKFPLPYPQLIKIFIIPDQFLNPGITVLKFG